jgi:hypothetical protein
VEINISSHTAVEITILGSMRNEIITEELKEFRDAISVTNVRGSGRREKLELINVIHNKKNSELNFPWGN